MEKNEVVNNLFEIETRSGEKINLTFNVVKTLFAGGENITELEFRNFFQICKVYKANPYIREAYIVKYGNQPATIVLDYKVLQQRAESNPNFSRRSNRCGLSSGERAISRKRCSSIVRVYVSGFFILIVFEFGIFCTILM